MPSPMSAKRIPGTGRADQRAGEKFLRLICHFGYTADSAACDRWLFYLLDAGWLSWSGVDLFFVLLIGGILIDAPSSPNYLKTYYACRFFPIIPICLRISSPHLSNFNCTCISSMALTP